MCLNNTQNKGIRDYKVVVLADGHTTKDRPHLDAEPTIQHHNFMWKNLIFPHGQVKVLPAAKVVSQIKPETQP